MKKDYMPVSGVLKESNEKVFLEEYWTKAWEKTGIDAFAENYIKKSDEYRIMLPYIKKLKPGSRLLDGGCGLGRWTIFFSLLGYDAVGLDISKETIKKLKEKFPAQNFIAGDITNTNFQDEYFDAYFSWGTFEHFERGLTECFQEAGRILRKNGYLFITVPYNNLRHIRRDQGKLKNWDDSFDNINGYKDKMRFYQWRLSKPELIREFEINGFKCLEVVPVHKFNGLSRAVNHDLHVKYGSKQHAILTRLLYPFYSKDYVSHMLMGIGMKK